MTDIFTRTWPASQEEILALERASLNAWPSLMTLWDGGWCLRLTPGARSRRINSVNILDSRDTSNSGERVARMRGLFERHGIQPTFRWTPLMPKGLVDDLLSAGWRTAAETVVMARTVNGLPIAPRTTGRPDIHALELPEWIGHLIAIDRSQADNADALLATLATIAAPLRRLYIESENGQPAATAFCVADGAFVGLFLVNVAESQRRRGHGQALLAAALQFAAPLGAKTAWLQVEADNGPAMALYAKAGFGERYRYIYLQPDAGP